MRSLTFRCCFRGFSCLLCLLGLLYLAGCSSHRTVVNRPPPATPAPAPSDRSEPANRPSETGPAGGTSRPRVTPVPVPEGYVEEGNASWYGVPFHGRRAANGETYDMYKLTAAHRTLPFDTLVRVTNLFNNNSTVVRITDRGPFIDNRVIDLSRRRPRTRYGRCRHRPGAH